MDAAVHPGGVLGGTGVLLPPTALPSPSSSSSPTPEPLLPRGCGWDHRDFWEQRCSLAPGTALPRPLPPRHWFPVTFRYLNGQGIAWKPGSLFWSCAGAVAPPWVWEPLGRDGGARRRLVALGPESSEGEPAQLGLTPGFYPLCSSLYQIISRQFAVLAWGRAKQGAHIPVDAARDDAAAASGCQAGGLSVANPTGDGLISPEAGRDSPSGSHRAAPASQPRAGPLGAPGSQISAVGMALSVSGEREASAGSGPAAPHHPPGGGKRDGCGSGAGRREGAAGGAARSEPGLPGAEEWPGAEEGALELNFLSPPWGWDLCCHLQGDAGCAAAGILMVWEAGGSGHPGPLPGCGSR